MTANWNGWERRQLWLNFRYYSSISLHSLKKTTTNVNQVSEFLVKGFKPPTE